MLATLATIALLHWVVLVTPGANVLLVSQLAASGHWRAALFAGFGITVVARTWATLALLGVNAVFAALPALRIGVQLAGAAYLFYVASRLWRSAAPTARHAIAPTTGWASLRMGVLTNIMNPKSALFFGSVFATALPPQPGAALLTAAVALVVVTAFVWHTVLALAFSHPWVQAGYAHQRLRLNRGASPIVGAFGLRLLAATANALRAR